MGKENSRVNNVASIWIMLTVLEHYLTVLYAISRVDRKILEPLISDPKINPLTFQLLQKLEGSEKGHLEKELLDRLKEFGDELLRFCQK